MGQYVGVGAIANYGQGYKSDAEARAAQEAARLKQEEEARRKAQGTAANQLASNFLKSWNDSLQVLQGYYNSGADILSQTWGKIDEENANIDAESKALMDEIDQSLTQYKAENEPLRSEAVQSAREGIATQREMTGVLKDLANPDYEGASGIAKADVSQEMESARQAEARRLQSLGINPTSGNYRDTMRKSYLNEAINKVLAGNLARINEKNRVGTAAVQAANSITAAPTAQWGIARDISQGEMDRLKQKSDIWGNKYTAKSQMTGALSNAGTGIANSYTNIANSYGENISKPLSELYASNLGVGMNLDPSGVNTSPNIGINVGG